MACLLEVSKPFNLVHATRGFLDYNPIAIISGRQGVYVR